MSNYFRKATKHFNRKPKTISIFKPNTFFNSVIEDIEALTKDFTCIDHVIIMAGTVDALKGNNFDTGIMTRKLKNVSQYTNIHFVENPMWKNRNILNKFIIEINKKLFNLTKNLNSVFITNNSLTNNNFYIENAAKYHLAKHILSNLRKTHNEPVIKESKN